MSMYLHTRDFVSGSGRRINEDLFGHNGADAVWMFDGATSTSAVVLDGVSEAAWFVKAVDRQLRRAEDFSDHGSALVRGLYPVRESYENRVGERRASGAGPSAAFAVATVTDDFLHVSALGDVTVVAQSPERYTDQIHPRDLRSPLERRLSAQYVDAVRAGESPMRVRKRIMAAIEKRRSEQLNKPGGYWMLGLNPDGAKNARTFRVPIRECRSLLLMTDGFTAAMEYGLVHDWADVFSGAHSLPTILSALRAVEEQDSDCVEHPRLKKSDDATAALIDVVA